MVLVIKWNVNNRSLKLFEEKKKNCPHAFWFYELERVFWEAFILINKTIVIYGRCFQYIGVIQSCSILCDLMDGSPPGSSVPEILQTRILESVVISLSRDWAQVSLTASRVFTTEPPGKPKLCLEETFS